MSGRRQNLAPAPADDPLLHDLRRLQLGIGAAPAGSAGRAERKRLVALRDELGRLLAHLKHDRDRLGRELSQVDRGLEATSAYARIARLTRNMR